MVTVVARIALLTVAVAVAGSGASAAESASGSAQTMRVPPTVEPDGLTRAEEITPDGRFVLFNSFGSNLVPGDDSGGVDGFVFDRSTGSLSRATESGDGEDFLGANVATDITPDGKFVVFQSDAADVVSGDTNGAFDVFVVERFSGVIDRVSLTTDGAEAVGNSFSGAISADGRYVAFASDAPNLWPGDTNHYRDIFVRDRVAKTTTIVSRSFNGGAGDAQTWSAPSISDDGQLVVFNTSATNIVPGDSPGIDVFVHDRRTGRTRLVSDTVPVVDGADDAPVVHVARGNFGEISGDGRFVVYVGNGRGTSVVGTWVRDLVTGDTELISRSTAGVPGVSNALKPGWWTSMSRAHISTDGRFVVFAGDDNLWTIGDANTKTETFLRDRVRGTTIRVSVTASGRGDPDSWGAGVSDEGRHVIYTSIPASFDINDESTWTYEAFLRDTWMCGTPEGPVSGLPAETFRGVDSAYGLASTATQAQFGTKPPDHWDTLPYSEVAVASCAIAQSAPL